MRHAAPVSQASWNADGTRILTASDDTVKLWYAEMEDLLEAACQRAPRNMTPAAWGRFMRGQGYRATCPNLPIVEGEGWYRRNKAPSGIALGDNDFGQWTSDRIQAGQFSAAGLRYDLEINRWSRRFDKAGSDQRSLSAEYVVLRVTLDQNLGFLLSDTEILREYTEGLREYTEGLREYTEGLREYTEEHRDSS